MPKSWDDACAPLQEQGPVVEAVRARLQTQAERLGFQPTGDPGLHILADGKPVWPQKRDGGWHSFTLPNGAREIALVSRTWRPADEVRGEDKRHLGVAVCGIKIDGASFGLDELEAGWLPIEGEAGSEWRWTEGRASLPAGALQIDIRLGGEPTYWVHAVANIEPGRHRRAGGIPER